MFVLIWAKIQKWIIGIAAIFAAALSLFGVGWWHGWKEQRQKEQVANQQAAEKGEKDATEIQQQASAAEQQLQKNSDAQTPPDVVKRDDLDTTR